MSEQELHYLVFGPQNNSYGKFLYTDNIGDFVGFQVPKSINENNWLEDKKLNNYFSLIKFDPNNLMMSDCLSCGNRWEIVNTFNTYNDLLKFFNEDENEKKYKVIHSLVLDNDDELICSYFDIINQESVINKIIKDEEIDNFYNKLIERNNRYD